MVVYGYGRTSLEQFALENNKEYLIKEFSTKNKIKPNEVYKAGIKDYLWNCSKCGSEYEMSAHYRTCYGTNCPYCAGRRVNHTNCLWTTHPEVAKLLTDSEIGYKITSGRKIKVEFTCPNCKTVKNKFLSGVTKRGFKCSKCSDGISYPEKFMMNVLDQLNVKYETQRKFTWSEKKKYDFYIPSLNTIIETHGRQHYEGGFESFGENAKNLNEEQGNDRLKEKLAKENTISKYIIIDCRKSDLDWMKNNIIDSKLNILFDLSNVDWLKCHEFSQSSFVKIASELWNNGIKDTKEIAKTMKRGRSTVTLYLKQAYMLGWCDYNIPKACNNKKVIQLTIQNKFIREWNSMTEAAEALNMSIDNISNVCRGKKNHKTAGGFKWVYKEKEYISLNN